MELQTLTVLCVIFSIVTLTAIQPRSRSYATRLVICRADERKLGR